VLYFVMIKSFVWCSSDPKLDDFIQQTSHRIKLNIKQETWEK